MYTFIVNPNSRSGKGVRIWHLIEPILKTKHIKYEVFFTKFQGHATRYTKALTADCQEHTLVILGGDGTINEVVNGICDFDKVTIGYIPTGSSNDFARGFKLPSDPVKALENILAPARIENLDIGTMAYKNHKRNFAVSAGMGFDAAICHQAVISKLKILLNKVGLGKLTYVGIALNRLFYSSPTTITMTLDDREPVTFEHAYFATAMNHAYEGGGFKFCPKAKPNDRKLDVIVIAGISKRKILCLLPTAFWGWHVRFRGVHTYSCKNVTFESAQALAVHTDGEPVFLQRKIHVSHEPKQLHIITI